MRIQSPIKSVKFILQSGRQWQTIAETCEIEIDVRVRVRIRTAGRALERHARGRRESGGGKRLVQQGVLLGAATTGSARLDARRRRQQQHGTGRGVRREESGEPREKRAQRFARMKGALQRAAVGAGDAKQSLCVGVRTCKNGSAEK